jgi:hypothetical protein
MHDSQTFSIKQQKCMIRHDATAKGNISRFTFTRFRVNSR